jgi:hypothetical protein
MTDPITPLSARLERFVLALLEHSDATQSHRCAGVVETSASNHSKPEQRTSLKPNKPLALAALTNRMGPLAPADPATAGLHLARHPAPGRRVPWDDSKPCESRPAGVGREEASLNRAPSPL